MTELIPVDPSHFRRGSGLLTLPTQSPPFRPAAAIMGRARGKFPADHRVFMAEPNRSGGRSSPHRNRNVLRGPRPFILVRRGTSGEGGIPVQRGDCVRAALNRAVRPAAARSGAPYANAPATGAAAPSPLSGVRTLSA